MALTAAQRAVIMTGSRPAWATGMDMAWDFTTNRTWTANPITDTHSATIYAQYQNGSFAPFAANTLVRTDLGLQTVPTRTNLNPRSWRLTSWTPANLTVASSAITPLLSSETVFSLTRASNANSFLTIVPTALPIVGQAVSLKFRAAFKATGGLVGGRIQGTYPARADVVVNTLTGAITFSGGSTYTNVSATSVLVGSFWQVELKATIAGSAVSQIVVGPAASSDGQWEQNSATLSDCYVTGIEFYDAPFAAAYISTDGSAATVNGNQQVVDLTGRLSAGVGGIIQVNVIEPAPTGFVFVLRFSDGTASNAMTIFFNAGAITCTITTGGLSQGGVSVPTAAVTGPLTFAFAYSQDFFVARVVGQAAATADTSATYPSVNRLGLGGSGYDAASNTYQITKRLALKFGAQNASTFADLFAKATILAAVS